MFKYRRSILFRQSVHGIQNDLRMLRRLIGITNSSEVTDFTSSGFGIHSLRIALLANLKGSIHKNLYEMIIAHQISHIVAGSTIGTNRRANHGAAMTYNLGSHKTNATNV